MYREDHVQQLKRQMETFKASAMKASTVFKMHGIVLSMEGYTSLIQELEDTDIADPEQVYAAEKDLLLWLDYLSEMKSVALLLQVQTENKVLFLDAYVDDQRKNPNLSARISKEGSCAVVLSVFVKELAQQQKLMRRITQELEKEYHDAVHSALRAV
jgi:uncharacterized protein YbaA (DUF1428 family)